MCKSKVSLFLLLFMLLLLLTPFNSFAEDLNSLDNYSETAVNESDNDVDVLLDDSNSNVSSNTNEVSPNNDAGTIGDVFSGIGPKEDDFKKASEVLYPIVKGINFFIAIVLGLLSVGLGIISVLDLVYIGLPITRDFLDGGRLQDLADIQAAGQMQGGMGGAGGMMGGMGGYGGGMGGYGGGYGHRGYGGGYGGGMMGGMMGGVGGMNGMNGMPQQEHGIGKRFVSDQAIYAVKEAIVAEQQGMMVRKREIVVSYMKYRTVFLILFGVCVTLFSTTIFTDLGIKAGLWILGKLTGML